MSARAASDGRTGVRSWWQLAGVLGQRFTEGQVEVNGPRTTRVVQRFGHGPRRQWTPGLLLAGGRHPRVGAPACFDREKAVLFDGLRGTRVVELRRPVRRADDEGHACVMGLDDSRMEFGAGGAARHADDDRPSRRFGEAEGVERRAPLVQADMGAESLRKRHHEGGGT